MATTYILKNMARSLRKSIIHCNRLLRCSINCPDTEMGLRYMRQQSEPNLLNGKFQCIDSLLGGMPFLFFETNSYLCLFYQISLITACCVQRHPTPNHKRSNGQRVTTGLIFFALFGSPKPTLWMWKHSHLSSRSAGFAMSGGDRLARSVSKRLAPVSHVARVARRRSMSPAPVMRGIRLHLRCSLPRMSRAG